MRGSLVEPWIVPGGLLPPTNPPRFDLFIFYVFPGAVSGMFLGASGCVASTGSLLS